MRVTVSICSTPACGYYYGSSEIDYNDPKCPKCQMPDSRKPITFVYSFYKAKGE